MESDASEHSKGVDATLGCFILKTSAFSISRRSMVSMRAELSRNTQTTISKSAYRQALGPLALDVAIGKRRKLKRFAVCSRLLKTQRRFFFFFFLSTKEGGERESERANKKTKSEKKSLFLDVVKEKKLSPSLFRSHVLCFSRRAALGAKRGRASEPSGRCFVIVLQEWERRERGKRTKRFLLGPFDSFKLIFLFFQSLIAGRL